MLDYFSGNQEGYLDCLGDLFGEDETKMIASFRNKTDWSTVVASIVRDKLSDLASEMEKLIDSENTGRDVDKEAEQAVNSYALEHPGELNNALNAL